jgi:hypothetical protein
VAVLLSGCAAQPQKTVGELDVSHPNYQTAECLEARKVALNYDDNVAGRMGIGLAAGLLLGPFGIPLAMAADAAQNEKREAVNKEIQKHCGGAPRSVPTKADVIPAAHTPAPAPSASLMGRLQELQEMRMKGLISEDEYVALRRRLLEQ